MTEQATQKHSAADAPDYFDSLEDRKKKEIEWADFRRSIDADNKEEFNKYYANSKFYSVNRVVYDFMVNWLRSNTKDKDVFEVACGNNGTIRHCVDLIRSGVAGDISPVSVEQAIEMAKTRPPMDTKVEFKVLDCEHTGLPDNSFDVMIESGALHHMDLDAAYSEAARLLRPDGQYFCLEAIRHNPFIHLYRKMTPHMRTAWEVEHILGRSQVLKGLKYFHDIEVHNHILVSLLAVPFRNTRIFKPLLSALEAVDRVVTKIPGVKWLSWQCTFILKNPRKDVLPSKKEAA